MSTGADNPVGPVPSPGARDNVVGRVPPRGGESVDERPPRRLRRLHRVWPDRDGIISYLLTPCIENREHVLNNETIFNRFVGFLLDSPTCYDWWARRFVIMPDHIHVIAHQGPGAVTLGQWIKAMKAVVGGVGPVPPPGGAGSETSRKLTRLPRTWRWQSGFHDHKFRTPESESRKWEYVCLNPVRAGLVKRPEDWPWAGEIFYENRRPELIRGTPPLFEIGTLIEEPPKTLQRPTPPRGGTRPTT